MNPPSEEVKRGLQALKLANERDLLACRARVRRLAHGLPAFDSVWIDALIQAGKLTHFQSAFIEQQRGAELQVTDEIVLTDQLHFDPVMPLFAARNPQTNEKFFVSTVQLYGVDQQKAVRGLRQLPNDRPTANAAESAVQNIHVDLKRSLVSVVCSAVQGEPLDRLMVRRGRFPEEVVRLISVGICDFLMKLDPGQFHGDLRLANVWLTSQGTVTLLNAGILNALAPVPSIHVPLPADAYDGLAPERFESTQPVSSATEAYALGCLLWQLLAGRPPFPLADPLAKIAAHRQRGIPDVREVAPETSAELAMLIQGLVQRQPSRRTVDFAIVRDISAKTCRHPRSRLKSFLHSFESAAPRRLGQQKPRGVLVPVKSMTILVLTLLAGIAFWNRDQWMIPAITRASAHTESVDPATFPPLKSRVAAVPEAITAPALKELPDADENGLVLIQESGEYRTRSLDAVATLTIRAAVGVKAKLLFDDTETVWRGRQVVLDNLEFSAQSLEEEEHRHRSLLQIESQELRLNRCQISESKALKLTALIHWTALDVEDSMAGRLMVTNTVVESSCPVIQVQTPLTTALFENVLQRRGGALLELRAGVQRGLRVPVVLQHCTVIEAEPLILFDQLAAMSEGGLLSLMGENTVLGITANCPLIGFQGAGLPAQWSQHIEIAAQGLIVRPESIIAGHRIQEGAEWISLPVDQLRIDGLLSGQFRIETSTGHEASTSGPTVIIEDLPVRGAAGIPGYAAERF